MGFHAQAVPNQQPKASMNGVFMAFPLMAGKETAFCFLPLPFPSWACSLVTFWRGGRTISGLWHKILFWQLEIPGMLLFQCSDLGDL